MIPNAHVYIVNKFIIYHLFDGSAFNENTFSFNDYLNKKYVIWYYLNVLLWNINMAFNQERTSSDLCRSLYSKYINIFNFHILKIVFIWVGQS